MAHEAWMQDSEGARRSGGDDSGINGGQGPVMLVDAQPKGSFASGKSFKDHRKAYMSKKKEKMQTLGPLWPDPMIYNPRSLFLMTLSNPVRRLCIRGIEWPWWDRIVLFLIFLNTLQLGFLYDPFDTPEYRPDPTLRNTFNFVGQIFSILFAVECVVKIMALGFCVGHKTYLSEAWNYLDFFIVVIGILDFIPTPQGDGGGEVATGPDVSSLRTLRVLRPLRAITKFPKLRFLIVLLLQCVPMLTNVMGLCVFIFFVFGILGVQLFQGVLRGNCYSHEDGTMLEMICSLSSQGGLVKCPANYECLLLAENPGEGNINFDSIGGAMVTIFVVMTMEGWAEVMYWVQDAYSDLMFIYFVVLIFVGPIFAIQLFLVVISNKYAQTEESLKGLAVVAEDGGGDQNAQGIGGAGDAAPVVSSAPETQSQSRRLAKTASASSLGGWRRGSANSFTSKNSSMNEGSPMAQRKILAGHLSKSTGSLKDGSSPKNAELRTASESLQRKILAGHVSKSTGSLKDGSSPKNAELRTASENLKICSSDHIPRLEEKDESTGSLRRVNSRGSMKGSLTSQDWPSERGMLGELARSLSSKMTLGRATSAGSNGSKRSGKETRRPTHHKGNVAGWRNILWQLKILAHSEALNNFIMGAIVLNFAVMAMDFNCDLCQRGTFPLGGDCAYFKAVLEISNIVFCVIFVSEMVIKVIGLGLKKYINSRMNCFDAVIVVISLVEVQPVVDLFTCYITEKGSNSPFVITCDLDNCTNMGGSNLTVLRTFRLVRVVKLLRAFPDVQKQIKIVVSVLGSVAALNGLIMIFILIFCILGMNTFGGGLRQAFDPGDMGLGATVWVNFPADPHAETRYGKVTEMDWVDRPLTPWQVEIRYGMESGVRELLGLDENGTTWVSEPEIAGAGVPYVQDIVPRLNFDDILHAMVTTFEILTIANWNDGLYVAAGSMGAMTGLYFYAIISVGNWMLLNLFIAILIQGFAEQKAVQLQENMLKMQQGLLSKLGGLHEDDLAIKIETLFETIDRDGSGVIDKFELRDALEELEITLRPKELQDLVKKYDTDRSGTIDFEEFLSMIKELVAKAEDAVKEHSSGANAKEVGKKDKKERDQIDDSQIEKAKQLHALKQHEKMTKKKAKKAPKSLWVFAENGVVRSFCRMIVSNSYFDKLILSSIFISTVCLSIERPQIGEDSPERMTLTDIDTFLNITFLAEAVLKIISLTFKEYIKTGWNRLDFLIVVTSLLDMFLTSALEAANGESGANVDLAVLKIFRIFRIFRALRPLRIIARARGLRLLVATLMSSVKPVLNTVGIALSVFAVFGVLGMQLMSGKMNFCSDNHVYKKEDCVGASEDGTPMTWMSQPINFDNIFMAVRALFVIATQDDWPDHMWAGVDVTGYKTGPRQDNNPSFILYFLVCIMVAGYLVVNIFVGVFVDCYNAAAADMEQPEVETKIARGTLGMIFDDPPDRIRCIMCEVFAETSFDLFIAFFICTNVITMAFESWKQSDWQIAFSDYANYFFTFVFGWECIFKLYAYRPRRYFSSNWNRFDFFIVMISFAGIVIDSLEGSVPINPTVLRVLRIFRVFRILRAFRIFKAAKGLQEIISTLVDSLPAIVNLFTMLALLFFVYSVLGVQLFGNICVDGEQSLPGFKAVRCMLTDPERLLDSHANFGNVPISLLTLFRISTGDAWGEVLSATQLEPGPRNISESVWKQFVGQLGYDPGVLPADDDRHIPYYDAGVDSSTIAKEVAIFSIRMWNATVFGKDDDLDWPYPPGPTSADESNNWASVARQALPGCLVEEEAKELELKGLMNCDLQDGYSRECQGTCALLNTSLFANFYFVSFVCMATFVLLQLVIAVLMEQLANNDGDSVMLKPLPGCEVLNRDVLGRIYRRWLYQATIKTKLEKLDLLNHPRVSLEGLDYSSGYSPDHMASSPLKLFAKGLLGGTPPPPPPGRYGGSEAEDPRFVGDGEEVILPKMRVKIAELEADKRLLEAELAALKQKSMNGSGSMTSPQQVRHSNGDVSHWIDGRDADSSFGSQFITPNRAWYNSRDAGLPPALDGECIQSRPGAVGMTVPPIIDVGRMRYFLEPLRRGGENDEEILRHHRPT